MLLLTSTAMTAVRRTVVAASSSGTAVLSSGTPSKVPVTVPRSGAVPAATSPRDTSSRSSRPSASTWSMPPSAADAGEGRTAPPVRTAASRRPSREDGRVADRDLTSASVPEEDPRVDVDVVLRQLVEELRAEPGRLEPATRAAVGVETHRVVED